MKKIMFSDRYGLTEAVIEGRKTRFFISPKDAFRDLFGRLSGKDVWERNLYVFVYEFSLLKS